MAYEVNRKQLNYMQAYIKYYSDGSEILQSYSTDVVKKTPDGHYIRLWRSWSPATNKQVNAYCSRRFRSIPFADGAVEDTKPIYKRKGYRFMKDRDGSYQTKEQNLALTEVKNKVEEFMHSLKQKNMRWLIEYAYNSACNKELRKQCKSEKRNRLLDALYSCTTGKPTKNAIGVLCKLNNFNIKTVWENGLKAEWGELKNTDE